MQPNTPKQSASTNSDPQQSEQTSNIARLVEENPTESNPLKFHKSPYLKGAVH